jgi:hypothetical protein
LAAQHFGGTGTIWGTLVGLAALATLQNGLRLAALPSELTGVVTARCWCDDRVESRGFHDRRGARVPPRSDTALGRYEARKTREK